MAGRYKAYPEYKSVDANITIPMGWNYCQAKRYLTVQSGDMLPADRVRDSGTPVVGGNGYRGFTDSANTKANTIVIGRVGAKCGCVHTIKEDFWASEHAFKVISRKQYNMSFMAYLLGSLNLNQYAITTAQPLLNTEIVTSKYISLPNDLIEQQKIANFLDHETAKIDTLITKQEKLIELLKEKRQAVISHTVTKGLNPDAPMKDSGVEWLGEVPEHWKVMRLKYVTRIFEQGWSPQCDSRPAEENEYGVLKVGCVNNGVFNHEENKALPKELSPQLQYLLKKDDLLISRANTKDLVGSAAVVYQDFENLILCDKLYRLRFDENVNPQLLAYYLSLPIVRQQIELDASGASHSMQNIGQSTIKEMLVLMPSRLEADLLVDAIKQKIEVFESTLNRANQQIQFLQERRTALISAAVTGKIDVRDWEPQGVQG